MSTKDAMSVWQSISKHVRRWTSRTPDAKETELIRIPVQLCRHYCGFRYGCDSYNPYENYIVGLHRDVPEQELQRKFEDFILWYRPRNFAQVLGIPISPSIPLWSYPWNRRPEAENHGWHIGLDKIPDILTHFCEEGVKLSRMEEEYLWLRQAYQNIKQSGYLPEAHSYFRVCEMTDGVSTAYLMLDGNHRLSALAALGVREVLVQHRPRKTVRLSNLPHWIQVKSGAYQPAEAEQVLRAYLQGVDDFPRSLVPATILEI